MLSKILKLEGAQVLTQKEQKSINGGVTEVCAKALAAGYAILKGSAPCPPQYPLAGGGCCFAD
ncbi:MULTISPECIES: hypothetical protein [unclassified Flavobacterium]|jgi:hypothetical protein|uniref:hypothetical protein n=1 Tax=unclassified Flavobacterium TaxID=196869 RepID=UPI000A3D818D|nr:MULTISPECIES: hypothetical protein [unclassified Flavobacterium]MEA9413913.1 hypothetical protein [Flavobacterium sp. PL02]OUL61612.1 hypothetical protein B8T70_14280 [Flavobacterium sp. AJR]